MMRELRANPDVLLMRDRWEKLINGEGGREGAGEKVDTRLRMRLLRPRN